MNKGNKKYTLVKTDFKIRSGVKLFRLKAKINIGTIVKKGDLGGYIESEKNLSYSGDAWVAGNAEVMAYIKLKEAAKDA